jgi:hypothetical protein
MKIVIAIGLLIMAVIFYHVIKRANEPAPDLVKEQFDKITDEHLPTKTKILWSLAAPESYIHLRTFWTYNGTVISIQTEFLYNEGSGQKTGHVKTLYTKNGVCQKFEIQL